MDQEGGEFEAHEPRRVFAKKVREIEAVVHRGKHFFVVPRVEMVALDAAEGGVMFLETTSQSRRRTRVGRRRRSR